MKKSANVLRQSSIEAVRSSPESFDEIERMFVGVIEGSEKLPA